MYRHPRLRHQPAHAATHGLPSFCIWERICRPQFCWLGESVASAGERETVCARVRAGESASQSDPVSESENMPSARLFCADSWTCRSSIEPDWPVICNRLGGLSHFKSPLNDLIDLLPYILRRNTTVTVVNCGCSSTILFSRATEVQD